MGCFIDTERFLILVCSGVFSVSKVLAQIGFRSTLAIHEITALSSNKACDLKRPSQDLLVRSSSFLATRAMFSFKLRISQLMSCKRLRYSVMVSPKVIRSMTSSLNFFECFLRAVIIYLQLKLLCLNQGGRIYSTTSQCTFMLAVPTLNHIKV
jgi:hypothetical protein